MAYKKGTWDLANCMGHFPRKVDGTFEKEVDGGYLGFVSGWAMAPAGQEGKYYREVTLSEEQWHSFWEEVYALRDKGWDRPGYKDEARYYFDKNGLPHPIADYTSFFFSDFEADAEREAYRRLS